MRATQIGQQPYLPYQPLKAGKCAGQRITPEQDCWKAERAMGAMRCNSPEVAVWAEVASYWRAIAGAPRQHLIVGAEAFERGLGCVQRGGVRSWDESSSADGCFGSRISFTIPAHCLGEQR